MILDPTSISTASGGKFFTAERPAFPREESKMFWFLLATALCAASVILLTLDTAFIFQSVLEVFFISMQQSSPS